MRVNGFTVGECVRYAATELVITTVAGILLGLAIGIPLGYQIQLLMEATDIQTIRGADTISIVMSSLLTVLFSAGINALVLRQVKTLKLSEINS